MPSAPRIVCVSNRLPVTAQEEPGKIDFQPSSGGLVTALGPVLQKARGVWIGWPGSVSRPEAEVRRALSEFSAQSEFELFPVFLDQDSIQGFYQGFANAIIWPLFHDLQTRCNFDPKYWSTYLHVQGLFCEEVIKHVGESELIWVHDYHLMGVGQALRRRNIKNKIAYFFHTPFPGPDIFTKLPWRANVVESMLNYDLIGFQTNRDLKNFIDCLELLTEVRCVARNSHFIAKFNGRECRFGAFPISIDFSEFEEIARSPEVEANAQRVRSDMNTEIIVLSIDRLDYTKGIPYRIRAFKRLLETAPQLKRQIALLQVVVPSRIEVPEYRDLQAEIERLVSQLNGELGEPGWVPVHHLFRSLTREDVIALYRASNVALVTPLKDGMNLVAKEYCASRIRDGGALVLSEFAGAAAEFKGYAFLVNPYDIDGVAKALENAIAISVDDRQERMRAMREIVKNSDVITWANSFLNAAQWEWQSESATQKSATIWSRLRRMANVFDI